MSGYLHNEARWAREKAVEASRRLERLRDARELSRDRKDAHRRLIEARWAARRSVEDAEAAVNALTPARVAATIAAQEATIAQWTTLAEEYEARVIETEGVPLFDGADGGRG